MTNKTQDRFVGRILAERYELLSRLGEGGMGMVYRARQLSMDREVAVKLLHPGLIADETTSKRFEVEMRAMARMEHPNAVQIFDYGRTEEGEAYLVMELLKGMTLEDLMAEEGGGRRGGHGHVELFLCSTNGDEDRRCTKYEVARSDVGGEGRVRRRSGKR